MMIVFWNISAMDAVIATFYFPLFQMHIIAISILVQLVRIYLVITHLNVAKNG